MSRFEIENDLGTYKAKLYCTDDGKFWYYSGISYNFTSERKLRKFLKSQTTN